MYGMFVCIVFYIHFPLLAPHLYTTCLNPLTIFHQPTI